MSTRARRWCVRGLAAGLCFVAIGAMSAPATADESRSPREPSSSADGPSVVPVIRAPLPVPPVPPSPPSLPPPPERQPEPPPRIETPPPALEPLAPGERRVVPDYDGRGPAPEGPGEGWLWVPRIVFAPVYLTFEFVLRRPIGWLLTTSERERWEAFLVDFFTRDDRKLGFVPTAFFDFGFRASVGGYFWWNDFIFTRNQLRLSAAYGGDNWVHGNITDRIVFSDDFSIDMWFDGFRRPDYIFHGLGFDSRQDQRSRYTDTIFQGHLGARGRYWRSSELRGFVSSVSHAFEGSNYTFTSTDQNIFNAVSQGWFSLPPGFDGYAAFRARLEASLDTRERTDARTPGVDLRVEGHVEHAFDIRDPARRMWLKVGGAAGVFFQMTRDHAVILSTRFAMAETLTEQPIPFLEQVMWGGPIDTLPGFMPQRLIGTSAALANLEYRYALWPRFDGSLHVGVGNVFADRFSDFALDRLRMSIALGLRTHGDPDTSFGILAAFGTETFARGATIVSGRLVVGVQRGF